MVELRAWERAHEIGAVHEARQLGSVVVGTEHLLLATLADPTVRWAFHTVGVEAHEVRDEVTHVMGTRRARRRPDAITPTAAHAVMRACADIALLDADDLGGVEVIRVLQALACRFLVRTKQDEARDILDRLGVLRRRAQVLATIESNARHARLPPPTERSPRSAGAAPSSTVRLVRPRAVPSPTVDC